MTPEMRAAVMRVGNQFHTTRLTHEFCVDPNDMAEVLKAAGYYGSSLPNPEGMTEGVELLDRVAWAIAGVENKGCPNWGSFSPSEYGVFIDMARAAIAAIASTRVEPDAAQFIANACYDAALAPDEDAEDIIFREAIKRGVDQDTADQISQAAAERISSRSTSITPRERDV